LQLAGLHMAKKSRFWGSQFEVRINNYWQLDWQSGKAPDFQGKNPLWSLFVGPTREVSPNRRFSIPETCAPTF